MMQFDSLYFVGAGGIGMAALERYYLAKGYRVAGYDLTPSQLTSQLASEGVEMYYDESADLIPSYCRDPKKTLVVYTPAVPETHAGLRYFRENGFEVVKRAQLLGIITHNSLGLCFSGTHGKTTTTSLIALMLEQGNFDPTVFVGGIVKEWGTTYRVGNSDYYVCEGDEYDGNFLNYYPKYVILNNLEMEHPERFANIDDYIDNFRNFLYTIQKDGTIVFNYDDENLKNLISSMMNFFEDNNIKVIGYTFNDNTQTNSKLNIIKVDKDKNKVVINGEEFKHNLLGEHNAKNITVATILALELGVNIEDIRKILKKFCGSKRRIDLVFSDNRIKLYDDYAHHHTQIKCTLEAIKENIDKDTKLIAVLEPHLISRIKNNVKEYNDALLIADYPIITKVFKSRESFMADLDVKSLLNNDNIEYIENFDDVIKHINSILLNNKNHKFAIVVMGAGNSYKIAEALKQEFASIKKTE